MLRVSEILINELRDQLETHQRNASGQASESLRENLVYNGQVLTNIQVVGVDYFDSIFNGIPAGGSLSLSTLNQWASKKQSRYGVGVGGPNVLKRILQGNAWINSQPEKLHLDAKTLNKVQSQIDIEVNKIIEENINKWI